MKKIIFITGGQRSGKSRYAQELALQKSATPVYLATSRAWDDDFRKRIGKHQSDRGPMWRNIEEEKHLAAHLFAENDVVLVDCVTLWLTNIFHDNGYDVEKALGEAKTEWDAFTAMNFTLIVVSNELGMSLHSETEAGRKFTDLQGWMNQYIAKTATEAYLMVSGIGVRIK